MKKDKANKNTQESSSEGVLVNGVDYHINDAGMMVLSKQFHLKRGYCCHSGCQNCPYEYSKSVDPNIPVELQLETDSEDDENEKYLDYLEGDFD